MEPRVESLVLHPSLLMASGIECITSRDARFLNAYKRYFADQWKDQNNIVMLTDDDFKLGGIMNPNDLFIIPQIAYNKCRNRWYGFPCLSRQQIFEKVYRERIEEILGRIFDELTSDMSVWARKQNISDLRKLLTRPATSGEIYSKIVALHLCGLGDKLKDAFGFMVLKYQTDHNDPQ